MPYGSPDFTALDLYRQNEFKLARQQDFENQLALLRERQAGEMQMAQQRAEEQRWNTVAGLNGQILMNQAQQDAAYRAAKQSGADRRQLLDQDYGWKQSMADQQALAQMEVQRGRLDADAQQADLQRQHQMQMAELQSRLQQSQQENEYGLRGRLQQDQNQFQLQRDQSQNEMQRGNLFDEMAAKQLQAGREYTPEQQQSLAQVESEIEALHRSVQNNEISFRDAKPAFKALEDKRNAIRIAPRGYAPVQTDQLQGRIINHDRAGPVYFGPDGRVQQLNDVAGENEWRMANAQRLGVSSSRAPYDPKQIAYQQYLKDSARAKEFGMEQPDPEQYLKAATTFFGTPGMPNQDPMSQQGSGSSQDFVGPETPLNLREQAPVDAQEAQAIRQHLGQITNDPTISQALRVGGPAAKEHLQILVQAMSAYADSIEQGREDLNAVAAAKNARGELMRLARMGSEAGMMLPDMGGVAAGIGAGNAVRSAQGMRAPLENSLNTINGAAFGFGPALSRPSGQGPSRPLTDEELRYRRRR